MKIAPIADVKARLSRYLDECEEGGPVIITRNGRPVAALVAVADDDELERLLLAHNPKLRQILDAAEERIRRTGGLDHETLWSQVAEDDRAADQQDKTR